MARGNKIDKQVAATLIVYALYNTDKQTASDFGVHPKTIQRYRKQLETDGELSAIVSEKRQKAETEWIDYGRDAMLSAIAFIRRASLTGKVTPPMVHSIAGALKIVSEVTATHRLIDLRMEEHARRFAISGDTGQDNRTLASPVIVSNVNE